MPNPTIAEMISTLNRFRVGRAVNADIPLLEASIFILSSLPPLIAAAREAIDTVDRQLNEDDFPVKYRAPFGALAKLRTVLSRFPVNGK